jgi:hypothetical protein
MGSLGGREPKKGKSAGSLKFCGNCGLIDFGFTAEEQEFLCDMVERFGLEAVRGWLKKKLIMAGGKTLDLKKMQASQIMRKNRARCWSPYPFGVEVTWADVGCYMWKPRVLNQKPEGPYRLSPHRKS